MTYGIKTNKVQITEKKYMIRQNDQIVHDCNASDNAV